MKIRDFSFPLYEGIRRACRVWEGGHEGNWYYVTPSCRVAAGQLRLTVKLRPLASTGLPRDLVCQHRPDELFACYKAMLLIERLPIDLHEGMMAYLLDLASGECMSLGDHSLYLSQSTHLDQVAQCLEAVPPDLEETLADLAAFGISVHDQFVGEWLLLAGQAITPRLKELGVRTWDDGFEELCFCRQLEYHLADWQARLHCHDLWFADIFRHTVRRCWRIGIRAVDEAFCISFAYATHAVGLEAHLGSIVDIERQKGAWHQHEHWCRSVWEAGVATYMRFVATRPCYMSWEAVTFACERWTPPVCRKVARRSVFHYTRLAHRIHRRWAIEDKVLQE